MNTLVLTQLDISLYNYETGDLFLKGFSGKSELRFAEDSEKHVLCMFYMDFNNLEITDEDTNYIRTRTVFTEEQKKEFRENFGDHVLIISCGDFIENVRNTFERKKLNGLQVKLNIVISPSTLRIESNLTLTVVQTNTFGKIIFLETRRNIGLSY